MNGQDPTQRATWEQLEEQVARIAEGPLTSEEQLYLMDITAGGLSHALRGYSDWLNQDHSLWRVAPECMHNLQREVKLLSKRSGECGEAFRPLVGPLNSIVKIIDACRADIRETTFKRLDQIRKQLGKIVGKEIVEKAWQLPKEEVEKKLDREDLLFTELEEIDLSVRCNQLILEELSQRFDRQSLEQAVQGLFSDEEQEQIREGILLLHMDMRRELTRRLKNLQLLNDFCLAQEELFGVEVASRALDELRDEERTALQSGAEEISHHQKDLLIGRCNELTVSQLKAEFGDRDLDEAARELYGPVGWREYSRGKRPLTRTVREELINRLRSRVNK